MKLIGFFACLLFVQIGCNRTPQVAPSKADEKKPIETTEWLELPLESLLENVVAKDKESVEEAYKAGRKQTVGLADGKLWLQYTRIERAIYLRGVGDLVSALGYVNGVTNDEIATKQKAQGLELHLGKDSLSGGQEAESKFSGRIEIVMAGQNFGDLVDAITKFYQNKPLLKDKPVLWVLAVPLYKELQDSKPEDKRSSFNDTVKIPMAKKNLVN